jgi:hypothetical protein
MPVLASRHDVLQASAPASYGGRHIRISHGIPHRAALASHPITVTKKWWCLNGSKPRTELNTIHLPRFDFIKEKTKKLIRHIFKVHALPVYNCNCRYLNMHVVTPSRSPSYVSGNYMYSVIQHYELYEHNQCMCFIYYFRDRWRHDTWSTNKWFKTKHLKVSPSNARREREKPWPQVSST